MKRAKWWISRLVQITFVLGLVLEDKTASAGGTIPQTAATCMPADYVTQFNRYTVTAGKVNHAGSNVDLVTFYCPYKVNVSGAVPFTVQAIGMVYRDSDGPGSGTFVAAQLWRMDRTNGNIVNLGTFSSNSFSDTGLVNHNQPITPAALDEINYVYYLRIDMDRSIATDVAQWNMVYLMGY